MESKIYNISGKETGKVTLPESIFGIPWNSDLVHQVLTSLMSNRRSPIAHTKTRGEVRGGGKKPWKQKGTGRARHGSRRSPIWVGGGVAHGPRNDKNFERKVNKKMTAKALLTILSRKNRDEELIFVDSINFEAPKAKHAKVFFDNFAKIKGLEKLSYKKMNSAYIALSKEEGTLKRSFSNFKNMQVGDIRNLNPLDVAAYKYLFITNPEYAMKSLESKVQKSSQKETDNDKPKKAPAKAAKAAKVVKPKTVVKLKVKKPATKK